MKLKHFFIVIAFSLMSFAPTQSGTAQVEVPEIPKNNPYKNETEAFREGKKALIEKTDKKLLNLFQKFGLRKKAKTKVIVKKIIVPAQPDTLILNNGWPLITGDDYFMRAKQPCDTVFIHDTLIIKNKRKALINIKF